MYGSHGMISEALGHRIRSCITFKALHRIRSVTTKSAIFQSLHASKYEGERDSRSSAGRQGGSKLHSRTRNGHRPPGWEKSLAAQYRNGQPKFRPSQSRVDYRARSSNYEDDRPRAQDTSESQSEQGVRRTFDKGVAEYRRSSNEGRPKDDQHNRDVMPISRSRPQQRFTRPSQYEEDLSSSEEVLGPLDLPYTTPASEFLYGASVVNSALQVHRRQLYKLYMHRGAMKEDRSVDLRIRQLALKAGVVVEKVSGVDVRRMDQMTAGRPHNGYVLEASPLPKLPITGFDCVPEPGKPFNAFLDYQSREEEIINGRIPQFQTSGGRSRYPFVILLDGILDPGNLGAILRSAFFFGVDAAIISVNCTAPLSPVSLKASAGAAEALPIASVKQTRSFLEVCRANGWQIFAADASGTANTDRRRRAGARYCSTSTLGNPTGRGPSILVLGSEEKGLYPDVQRLANTIINIEGRRIGQVGVDSLNVSVAAALLCDAFLKSNGDNIHKLNRRDRDRDRIHDDSDTTSEHLHRSRSSTRRPDTYDLVDGSASAGRLF